MASIFTFDPDPPRVSSPWSNPPTSASHPHHPTRPHLSREITTSQGGISIAGKPDHHNIERLEPEPQEGPTEYKLHLLLRKRRSFVRTSTGRHVSGSLRRIEISPGSSIGRSVSECALAATPPQASATESRQHRLEQLTTQLRWRLKQSCSVHLTSNTTHVMPHFLDASQSSTRIAPQRLPADLEDTKGALYEIGVADDGTFVGLAEDEMEESLNTLRAMATSLGCKVSVQRMVQVGDCEWLEDVVQQNSVQKQTRTGKLWVAEALVRPGEQLAGAELAPSSRPTQQMRVSLTGATGSGKSSLLGSLTTATLDNGRGSSRLSLLRHRHEIASGMTSSITQELIGYHDVPERDETRGSSHVVNYGSGNVSSWVEIHSKAEGGRLVFLSDSAGHPRFRRTTVRGVVGWDPHWTLACIPADNVEDTSGRTGASPAPQDVLGPAAADVDLSQAHLQLCLNLQLPLVLLITKYDLATKGGLKQTLSKVLSAIKAAGRTPYIVRKPSNASSEADLNIVTAEHFKEVKPLIDSLKSDPLGTIPILLTSCVNGTGVNTLHAFLRDLPLPDTPEPPYNSSSSLFFVEDIYSNVPTTSRYSSNTASPSDRSVIIGGHLRHGTLKIGDELLLGPYPVDTGSEDSDSGSGRGSTPPNHSNRASPVPTSRSFPGALTKGILRSARSSSDKHAEWRRVSVTSLRNLRLPVQSLHAGQVGTIGIAPVDIPITSPAVVRIRKGMVLTNGEPKGNRVIEVAFSDDNASAVRNLGVGTAVVVYVASVRASAKVVSVAADRSTGGVLKQDASPEEEDVDAFGFGFGDDDDAGDDVINGDGTLGKESLSPATVVTFQFIASREFVEDNAKVLVLPGGGPGLYGVTERGEKGMAALEGFVGRVIEKY